MTEFPITKGKLISANPRLFGIIGVLEHLDVEGLEDLKGELGWIEQAVYERRVAARKEREKKNESS